MKRKIMSLYTCFSKRQRRTFTMELKRKGIISYQEALIRLSISYLMDLARSISLPVIIQSYKPGINMYRIINAWSLLAMEGNLHFGGI